jgi:hypothetical protein
MKTKRGISLPSDYMGWLILGVFILIVVGIISLGLKGNLSDKVEYVQGLMRFGRG